MSETVLSSKSDNHELHFSDDSDFMPCTPPVTLMRKVTAIRHVILLSPESDE
jgi:hypothetical protein